MNTPNEESVPRALNWVDYADSIRRGVWPESFGSDRRPKSRDANTPDPSQKLQRQAGSATPDDLTAK